MGTEISSKAQVKAMPTKPVSKPTIREMGERSLKQAKYFDAILNDGEILSCKLLDYGQYDLLVETEIGRILLPKHSVKYFVLERNEE